MAGRKGGGRGDKGKGWRFSARERRAILFLLPLVAVSVWILWSVARPRYDDSVAMLGDRMAAQARENRPRTDNHTQGIQDRKGEQEIHGGAAEPEKRATLSCFDPNTVTYEEMRTMGIAARTAAGIVKYRARGKVFQIPEDFATCYGITDSMYAALKPYIRIGEEYRLEPAASYAAHSGTAGRNAQTAPAPTVTAETTEASLSAKPTGAANESGMTNMAVTENETETAKAKQEKLDLNSADSLVLVSVRGIGARTASDIIAYREKLGGFHSVEQLKELKVMTERNYETMIGQIWADSCKIQKIDINFASPNAVSQHPYISGKKLRRILSNRQLKGGWSTIEDMIEDNTLTPEEAARLAPYLHFTAQPRK
jgi:competence ComEA-like helix-hairpin-helix protein